MALPPAAARLPDRCSGLAVCRCGAAGTYSDRRSERRCPGETARTVAPSRARRQRRCDRTHNPPGSRRREAAPGSPPLPPPFRAGVPLLAPRVLCAPRDTPESRSGRSCPWSSHCAQRLSSYSNESELSRRTLPPCSQRLQFLLRGKIPCCAPEFPATRRKTPCSAGPIVNLPIAYRAEPPPTTFANRVCWVLAWNPRHSRPFSSKNGRHPDPCQASPAYILALIVT